MSVLKNHALKNMWAGPLQDHQHWIRPTRTSPDSGFFRYANVMWEAIPLPNAKDLVSRTTFHTYPLGQMIVNKVALPKMVYRTWYRCDELSAKGNVTIDAIAENGCMVPLANMYLCMTREDYLILAIAREDTKLGIETVVSSYGEAMTIDYTLDNHGITVRFYNNAYLHTKEWRDTTTHPNSALDSHQAYIKSQSDYLEFMVRARAIEEALGPTGRAMYYSNGYLINRPQAYTPGYVNTLMSMRFDATIKDVRYFPIATLPGFVSTKDKDIFKYLLVSDPSIDKMEYKDDCDFYLVHKVGERVKGVRITEFNGYNVNQITHTAWSVARDAVNYLSANHTELSNIDQLSIMVVVRQGGMFGDISFQHNRIEDLYHLSRGDIISAMVGVNSTVPEWRAEELENSDYMKLMGTQRVRITNELVENAYGYNSAVRAVSKSGYRVIDGVITLDVANNIPLNRNVPSSAVEYANTIAWYSNEGKLLEVSEYSSGDGIVPAPSGAAKAEVVHGSLVRGIGDVGVYQDQEIVLDHHYGLFGHRNYVCSIVNGIPDGNWEDVTDGPYAQYIIPEDGSTPYVRWNYALLSSANYYPATKIASKVNVIEHTFLMGEFDGELSLSLLKLSDLKLSVLGVPPGMLTVWMDGNALINGLDYYYDTRLSKLHIVKVPERGHDPSVISKVVIMHHGYMNPVTKGPYAPRDIGFVRNGMLSMNGKFNPWHDSDVRVTVNGSFRLIDEVGFAEVGIDGPEINDGFAYSVEDYGVVVEPYTTKKSVDYRKLSMDLDSRISDYLTPLLPEPKPKNNYVTPHRHTLYSVVMSVFLDMCVSGRITDLTAGEEMTDKDILDRYGVILNQYRDYDPILNGFNIDHAYVFPHPLSGTREVTSTQYRFLQRVNKIFLLETLDLSPSITIREGT